MLPRATAQKSEECDLARMERRGDPLIGERLRTARGNVAISQERLGEEAGVGRSTIAGIEAATRPAGRQTLMKLASFFNVPVDYFTSRDELLAQALWVLGRLPRDELEALVQLMTARATRDRLPPDRMT